MKRIFFIAVVILLGISSVYAVTGKEIMEKSDALPKPDTVKSRAVMTIFRGGSVDETLKMSLIGKRYGNNEKLYLTIGSPRNMKVLTHTGSGGNDKQWVKMRDGRKKPIRSDNDRKKTFVGSHLFYEDLRSRDIGDYNYKIIGSQSVQSHQCYKVEAVPKAGKSIYDKAVFYVIKSGPFANFIVSADIYYKGYFYKKLINYNLRKKDGIITPYKSVMVRKQRNGNVSGKTVVQIKRIKYNGGVNQSRFNPNAL